MASYESCRKEIECEQDSESSGVVCIEMETLKSGVFIGSKGQDTFESWAWGWILNGTVFFRAVRS